METLQSLLRVFQSRKMAALLLLGFASGLPYNLTRDTLSTWMAFSKVDLGAIGWFSLVNFPITFKFLWSPLVDRYVPPFLGRRRGWMALTQVALLLAIVLMACQSPASSLPLLAAIAIGVSFLSATQDIAIDAYRTDVLREHEVGAGVAIWVTGYRIALLLTGGVALAWAKAISWPGIYLVMAGLIGLCLVVSIFAPEPAVAEDQAKAPTSLVDAVYRPFLDFFQRSGWGRGAAILLFVVLFKWGDYLVAAMVNPFLVNTGFDAATIGQVKGVMGLVATIVGGLVGGAILSQIGINRSLWVFGVLQALSNLAYALLAWAGKDYTLMVLTVNLENFCVGLATAAFLGFLMRQCNPQFSATQYALLSSLVALSRDVLASPAGVMAKGMGWPAFFSLTFVVSLVGMAFLPIFAPWNSDHKTSPEA